MGCRSGDLRYGPASAGEICAAKTGANGPDPATVVLTTGFGRSAAPFNMTASGIADWFAVSAIRKNPASPAMGTEEILDGMDGQKVSRRMNEIANSAGGPGSPVDLACWKPNEWRSCLPARL
jgi:hypothetical protein